MTARLSVLSLLLLNALALPSLAHAQYKWTDETGQVVYSDRPPNNPRLAVKVLRGSVAVPMTASTASAPRQGASDAATAPVADATTSDKGAADKGSADKAATDKSGKDAASTPKTLADKDLAFKRRQQEKEQAERKLAEQTQKAAQLAKICEDRRTDLRTLDSGARISRVDANGERGFMSEEEIGKRRESLQKALSEDCRAG